MRSRARGWTMPAEDIPSMLQMIQEKIASSEIEVHHRATLVRLKSLSEGDLEEVGAMTVVKQTGKGVNKDYEA